MELSREEQLVNKLTNNQYTISTVESCTGGLLSGTIVNVSGASEVFSCGFVTYANEAKERMVNVNHETLEQYGAVSPETAKEMAAGCAKATGSDMALSTTGIAGPLGGTPEKPVGLVYIGCHFQGETYVVKNIFKGDRMEVRLQTVQAALALALQCLNKEL